MPASEAKNFARGGLDEEDKDGSGLEDSASAVLFHPPAAHEEHSADSAGDDSAIVIGESPQVNARPAANDASASL